MPEPGQTTDLAQAVQEVSERASLLIREEIELAKAEIAAKVSKLARGVAAGAAAGVFLLGALIYALHAASWLLWKLVADADGENIYIGYALTTALLVLLAALAGLIAYRLVRKGAPPTPVMAIEEAQRIRDTVAAAQRADLPGSST